MQQVPFSFNARFRDRLTAYSILCLMESQSCIEQTAMRLQNERPVAGLSPLGSLGLEAHEACADDA